jgi:hypothetical protein
MSTLPSSATEMTMPALVFFDFLCGQVTETIEIETPEGKRNISMMNVCDHYTVYDETHDQYYNYTLSKRDGWNAALYDLNGARRMLELISSNEGKTLTMTDLNSKQSAQLLYTDPNEVAEVKLPESDESIKFRLISTVLN